MNSTKTRIFRTCTRCQRRLQVMTVQIGEDKERFYYHWPSHERNVIFVGTGQEAEICAMSDVRIYDITPEELTLVEIAR